MFTIECNVNPKEYIIRNDFHRIVQVINNLCSNSFKFTSPKGNIKLIFEEITKSNSIYLSVTINDDGYGID